MDPQISIQAEVRLRRTKEIMEQDNFQVMTEMVFAMN